MSGYQCYGLPLYSGGPGAEGNSPVLATSDPDVVGRGTPSCSASPGHSCSPVAGKPRTPRTRVAVKDSSKPVGPIHHKDASDPRATQVEKLRSAASAQIGVAFGQDGPAAASCAAPALVPTIIADDGEQSPAALCAQPPGHALSMME